MPGTGSNIAICSFPGALIQRHPGKNKVKTLEYLNLSKELADSLKYSFLTILRDNV